MIENIVTFDKFVPDKDGIYHLPGNCKVEPSTSFCVGKFVAMGADGLYLKHDNETDSHGADICYFDSPMEAAAALGYGPDMYRVVHELAEKCRDWLMSNRDYGRHMAILRAMDKAFLVRPWLEYEYLRAPAAEENKREHHKNWLNNLPALDKRTTP